MKMESINDSNLPHIIIDHLTAKDPSLKSQNRENLVYLASKSLSYLDYLISVQNASSSGTSSPNNDRENVAPNVQTFVSWKILESQLDENLKKETIIICLNHHKFYKHLKDIKREFMAKWEPEYSDQMKVCFCLDVAKSDTYCRILKDDKSATIAWDDLYMEKKLLELFVRDLWNHVLQLA